MTAPDPPPSPSGRSGMSLWLSGAGMVYLGLGLVLGTVWLLGDATDSLFPTGWLLPAVLVISGGLMLARRRFDIVAVLFGGLTLAVFQLDLALYLDGAALGVDDPAAFDATIVVAVLGLAPLVLRPGFRR